MICAMNHKQIEGIEWGVFRGDRLKKLRELRDLSKVDLMRLANQTRFRPGLNSPSRLSDLERLPDQSPSMPLLAALVEVLETNAD